MGRRLATILCALVVMLGLALVSPAVAHAEDVSDPHNPTGVKEELGPQPDIPSGWWDTADDDFKQEIGCKIVEVNGIQYYRDSSDEEWSYYGVAGGGAPSEVIVPDTINGMPVTEFLALSGQANSLSGCTSITVGANVESFDTGFSSPLNESGFSSVTLRRTSGWNDYYVYLTTDGLLQIQCEADSTAETATNYIGAVKYDNSVISRVVRIWKNGEEQFGVSAITAARFVDSAGTEIAHIAADDESPFGYLVGSNEVTVLRVIQPASASYEKVVIPETVENKPVVAIAEGSLLTGSGIWNPSSDFAFDGVIELPSTLRSVGDGAFDTPQTNTGITTFVVPEGSQLASIGESAFNLNTLTSFGPAGSAGIVIPEGVTTIGANAFADGSYASVEIPASVTTIGDEAFGGTTSLESITIAEGSKAQLGSGVFGKVAPDAVISIPETVQNADGQGFPAQELTLKAGPGSVTGTSTELAFGSKLSDAKVPDPAAPTGLVFKGWYTDEDLTDALATTTRVVTGPVTLYARWELAEDAVPTVTPSATSGETITLTAAAKHPATDATYRYAWSDASGKQLSDKDSLTVSASGAYTLSTTVTFADGTEFTVKSEPVTVHAVTFYDRIESTPDTKLLVMDGAPVPEPATDPSLTGYTFTGWYLVGADGQLMADSYDFKAPVTQDLVLNAGWDEVKGEQGDETVEPPTDKPTDKPADKPIDQPTDKGADEAKMPQTSDPTSFSAPLALVAGGAVIVAAAAITRKRTV